jgi:hypothetical protein
LEGIQVGHIDDVEVNIQGVTDLQITNATFSNPTSVVVLSVTETSSPIDVSGFALTVRSVRERKANAVIVRRAPAMVTDSNNEWGRAPERSILFLPSPTECAG